MFTPRVDKICQKKKQQNEKPFGVSRFWSDAKNVSRNTNLLSPVWKMSRNRFRLYCLPICRKTECCCRFLGLAVGFQLVLLIRRIIKRLLSNSSVVKPYSKYSWYASTFHLLEFFWCSSECLHYTRTYGRSYNNCSTFCYN